MFFFFNDPATTEIFPLSLHDALPISRRSGMRSRRPRGARKCVRGCAARRSGRAGRGALPAAGIAARDIDSPGMLAGEPITRSEEHTSELQSRQYLVCRLLLEKKKMQS